MQKRVLAIHDISCFGKCSLTVALPVISAAGLECTALPTAVLSTHTGGICGYTYRDLTDDIQPIADHWRSIDLKFDAIYTGYLGSFRQLELVEGIFDTFRPQKGLIVVDPVMADNGTLYAGFSDDFPRGMAKLCAKADVILPNVTEAALMLGCEYREGPYEKDYVETMLRRLSGLGPKKVVLTGISFDSEHLGAACYDRDTDKIDYCFDTKIEGSYHGTGDVFASAVTAACVRGLPLAKAVEIAVRFTVESIARTAKAGTDRRYGVNFEESIPTMLHDLAYSCKL